MSNRPHNRPEAVPNILDQLRERGQLRDLRTPVTDPLARPEGLRRAPAPGERAPLTATIVGQAGGPWALIGDGGVTIACGMGDATKMTLLGLLNLAAIAVQELPTEKVREALDRAAAIITAQADAAERMRQQLAAAPPPEH